MTGEGPGARLERLLDQTARRVSGSALHPLEILRCVETAVEEAVRHGAAPNDIRVALCPADYDRYTPALGQLREEVESLLDGIERRRALSRVGERMVSFERVDTVSAGAPRVTALFADTQHREQAPPPGATRRITRHRGVALVLGDGTSVAVTHTPFTIGRGPGNDLVLTSLAVSRRHAELVRSEHGFALCDLGSRNGLVVNGRRRDRVDLAPGVVVTVGDVGLRLERQA